MSDTNISKVLTLPIFLQVISSILAPMPGDEFFGKSAGDRWCAYNQFYTNADHWLREKHSRVWQIIQHETDIIQRGPITDDILHYYIWEVQERAKWFLDEED